MDCFRVDKRAFEKGTRIASAHEYAARLDPPAASIEAELEQLRPADKPSRSHSLFVFESENSARKHWSKMTDGKLYRVEIDVGRIGHRGDMALLDEMLKARKGGRNTLELVARYWRGEMSEAPEVELMVPDAIVAEVLSTSEVERTDYLKRRHGFR